MAIGCPDAWETPEGELLMERAVDALGSMGPWTPDNGGEEYQAEEGDTEWCLQVSRLPRDEEPGLLVLTCQDDDLQLYGFATIAQLHTVAARLRKH